jgi:anti-sigma B factor antagonist
MRITTVVQEDRTLVRIYGGRLDASVAADLRRGLSEALAAVAGPTVIDLGDIAFIDSSALGALVGALKLSGNPDVKIANAQPPVRTVFRMTRIDRAISMLDVAA